MSFYPPNRPYPDDRYEGPGEASATWRSAGGPPGGIHGFRNDSDTPASMLILFAPGAPREAYFEGLRHIADTGEFPTEQEMAEYFRVHDTYWVSD
ncbi:MAG TPA: hypothetical protein VHZ96_06565 [Frankiaceae bacterium]|jgi:hypothetical protein|nr:hypothetical protein [Frankiaceae bacterium]